MTQSIAAKIANLAQLSMPDLWKEWDTYFPRRPDKTARVYLESRIAYKMQESVHGALPALTRNRLIEIGAQQSCIKVRTGHQESNLLPGTILVREHAGQEHRVLVTPNGGFEYLGKHYKSLSAVARHITNTSWSGPVFFGLKKSGGAK